MIPDVTGWDMGKEDTCITRWSTVLVDIRLFICMYTLICSKLVPWDVSFKKDLVQILDASVGASVAHCRMLVIIMSIVICLFPGLGFSWHSWWGACLAWVCRFSAAAMVFRLRILPPLPIGSRTVPTCGRKISPVRVIGILRTPVSRDSLPGAFF